MAAEISNGLHPKFFEVGKCYEYFIIGDTSVPHTYLGKFKGKESYITKGGFIKTSIKFDYSDNCSKIFRYYPNDNNIGFRKTDCRPLTPKRNYCIP